MAGRVNVPQGTCDEDLPVLAATDKVRRELLERHQAAGARRMERRRALRRQRNDGRKRSGVACRGRDLAATLRYRSPPRPPGEGSTTGTAHRALTLEPRRFRYAYRTGHAARRGDVTRSIENRMDTITSMAQAREDAPFSLRTSRWQGGAIDKRISTRPNTDASILLDMKARREPNETCLPRSRHGKCENVRIDRCRDRDRACFVVLKANAPLGTQLWIRPVREFRKPSRELLWASKEPTRGDVSVMRSLATIERHRRRLPCPLAVKCARPGRLPDARNVLDFNDHQASYHATNSQCGLLTCPSASTLSWL